MAIKKPKIPTQKSISTLPEPSNVALPKNVQTDKTFTPPQKTPVKTTVTPNPNYNPKRKAGDPNAFNVAANGTNYPTSNPDFVPKSPEDTIKIQPVGKEFDVSVRGGETRRFTAEELKAFNGEGGVMTNRVMAALGERAAQFNVPETEFRRNLVQAANAPFPEQIPQAPTLGEQAANAVPDLLQTGLGAGAGVGAGALIAAASGGPITATAVGAGIAVPVLGGFFSELVNNQNEEIAALGAELDGFNRGLSSNLRLANRGEISPQEAVLNYRETRAKLNTIEREIKENSKTITGKKLKSAQIRLAKIQAARDTLDRYYLPQLETAILNPQPTRQISELGAQTETPQ